MNKTLEGIIGIFLLLELINLSIFLNFEKLLQKQEMLTNQYLLENSEATKQYEELLTKYNQYVMETSQITQQNQDLITKYDELGNECERLKDAISNLSRSNLNQENLSFRNNVITKVENYNCTVVTILYYSNFGSNEHIMTLRIPNELYQYYHQRIHPQWIDCSDIRTVSEYITVDDPVLIQIVTSVREQTKSEEELANALLNFVQDKGHILSLRYYPSTTIEYKYPIETLVEMGGDCDAHMFLYGTLLKIAGFKAMLVRSEFINQTCHVAIAVHLENSPSHSTKGVPDYYFLNDNEKYYYAETTFETWYVGDFPPQLKNLTFSTLPI